MYYVVVLLARSFAPRLTFDCILLLTDRQDVCLAKWKRPLLAFVTAIASTIRDGRSFFYLFFGISISKQPCLLCLLPHFPSGRSGPNVLALIASSCCCCCWFCRRLIYYGMYVLATSSLVEKALESWQKR